MREFSNFVSFLSLSQLIAVPTVESLQYCEFQDKELFSILLPITYQFLIFRRLEEI